MKSVTPAPSDPSSPDLSRSERYALYRRLLAFAKPYRLRLCLGILAGILSAGTLFVIFDNANDAVASFRSGEKKVAVPQPSSGPEEAGPSQNAEKAGGPAATDSESKIKAKLDKIEQRLARRVQLDVIRAAVFDRFVDGRTGQQIVKLVFQQGFEPAVAHFMPLLS